MSHEHRAIRGYPSEDFLFWYVATYKPKALFNLLTQKDQRVLKYATRGVVQEKCQAMNFVPSSLPGMPEVITRKIPSLGTEATATREILICV